MKSKKNDPDRPLWFLAGAVTVTILSIIWDVVTYLVAFYTMN
jgi:hypothetical protein